MQSRAGYSFDAPAQPPDVHRPSARGWRPVRMGASGIRFRYQSCHRNGADNEALSASRSHSGCCQAFCLDQAHAFHHRSDMAVLEGHDLRAQGKSAHGIRKRLPTRCRYEEITIADKKTLPSRKFERFSTGCRPPIASAKSANE